MANPFVHVELTTGDLESSRAFYGKLFDWKFDTVPMDPSGPYTLIKVGEGTGGGMFEMADAPPMWLPYVLVDDIEAATAKARSLGARLIRENVEVKGVGWLTIFTDPQGAMLALWQQKPG
jgi:predicted enzyme related to lactoylglutathione lyase